VGGGTAVVWMRAILGPAYYEPRTAWGPVQALLVMIGVYAVALVVTRWAVFEVMVATTPGEGRRDRMVSVLLRGTFLVWAGLLAGVLLLGTAWLLARRGGMRPTDVLALRVPLCGLRVLVLIGVLVALGLAADFFVQLARVAGLPRHSITKTSSDLPFWAWIARNAGWPLVVLSIGIVGPIADQVWFRGLLLPALAETRLGFWGAGLLISALLAAMHLVHSPLVAVVPIFLGGLFLTWTLGLTGSLWVPIAIHTSYSLISLLLARLTFWGLP